ncbi:MAG: FkbM family methyltransferase [Verrucomicrobia bacterium]|nr:FkbM family methyltransferase [Verrucomicrobiota bacterium]
MTKFSWLLRFPHVYAWLSAWKSSVNFEKQLYLRSIKKGDVIFDIGANIGYFSVLFSKLCGKHGYVHCFEPVPETFESLEHALRNLKNAKANNLAAGDSEGRMEMSYDPKDPEKASLLGESIAPASTRTVKVLPLDTYARQVKLSRLDFLKCDVEGFELNALKGMKDTLARHRPQISLEITLPDEGRIELVELLESLGYDSFRKIEKGFPQYDPNQGPRQDGDYFYLHATSSLAT